MRGIVVVFAVLGALLAATGVFVYYGLFESHDASLGVHGWTAMVLGIVFSLAVGIGLMSLVFYSSRHGYDDLPGTIEHRHQPDDPNARR